MPTESPSCPLIPAEVPGLTVVGQNRITCHFLSLSLWSPGRGQAPVPIPGLRGAVPSWGVLVLLRRWEQWVWAENVSPQMAVIVSYLIFVSVTV